jgi:hypothetical protein
MTLKFCEIMTIMDMLSASWFHLALSIQRVFEKHKHGEFIISVFSTASGKKKTLLLKAAQKDLQ